MNTVIVHGPKASGKTRHADEMKRHFGCSTIIDEWQDGTPRKPGRVVPGALHLSLGKPRNTPIPASVLVLTITEALQRIGVVK